MEEVRKRSSTNYKKIKDIMVDRKEDFFVFVNEHHKYGFKNSLYYCTFSKSWNLVSRDTYIERKPGESANDRNDRAIRAACLWYQSHLEESNKMRKQSNKIQVVLLTQDARNREIAVQEGLHAYKLEEYVKSMKDHPELQDKLAANTSDGENDDRKAIFPEHLPPGQILSGIKSGKFLQVTSTIVKHEWMYIFVSVISFSRDRFTLAGNLIIIFNSCQISNFIFIFVECQGKLLGRHRYR